jgi:hypothetical protein
MLQSLDTYRFISIFILMGIYPKTSRYFGSFKLPTGAYEPEIILVSGRKRGFRFQNQKFWEIIAEGGGKPCHISF